MTRHARKRRGRRVRTDETRWPVETAIIDDNGGIVLDRTVVIDLPEDAGRRIDRSSGGCGVSLSASDERGAVGSLGSEGQAVIGRKASQCTRRLHDVRDVDEGDEGEPGIAIGHEQDRSAVDNSDGHLVCAQISTGGIGKCPAVGGRDTGSNAVWTVIVRRHTCGEFGDHGWPGRKAGGGGAESSCREIEGHHAGAAVPHE